MAVRVDGNGVHKSEHPFDGAFPDPNEEKEKDLQAEIERRRYEDIMKTADGRWVMWQIIDGCGVRGMVYDHRSAGIHSVGISLLDKLRQVNAELYHLMLRENDK